jgi:hypothetical protein
MRRILLVLTAALVMAAMVVVTAAPAFADKGIRGHSDCAVGNGNTACVDAGLDVPGDPDSAGASVLTETHNPKFGRQTTRVQGSGGIVRPGEGSGAAVNSPGSNDDCRGSLSDSLPLCSI